MQLLQVTSLPTPGVAFLAFSPTGAFLVTCRKATKVEGAEAPRNLQVGSLNGDCMTYSVY